MTFPWRALLLFSAIAVGATTAIAALCHAHGWTVTSAQWAILAPLAMWAPALARLVTRATVDREPGATLTLRRWGITGARVIVEPLVYPLLVYAAAYAIAWGVGVAQFSPGAYDPDAGHAVHLGAAFADSSANGDLERAKLRALAQ